MNRYFNMVAMGFFLLMLLVACGDGNSPGYPEPEPTEPPSAPVGLTATAELQTVTLQWEPALSATSYSVYVSDISGADKSAETKFANVSTPYTYQPVNAGTYYYTVTATNAIGESPVSAEVSVSVNLIAFITSSSGSGNLGTWFDAEGSTGLAAADNICQAGATAAGLTGTFRAWLSDANDDAYCRLHNLAGKKYANCGQSALPATAGPWIRTDGFPFSGRIDQMLNSGQVFAPIRYDEYGAPLNGPAYFFSNTNASGSVNLVTSCSNWTSGDLSSGGGSGSSDGTSWMWDKFYSSCDDTSQHLLCMQTDEGPTLSVNAIVGKKAFLSSASGKGNLSAWPGADGNTGVAAGDAVCQHLALTAGITNADHFKAWLSDGVTSPSDRFSSDGPWVRIDGVKIADSKADLADGSLFTSVNVTESGNYRGNYAVWTGTKADGSANSKNCNGWADATNGFAGEYGMAAEAGARWTDSGSVTCDADGYMLYCMED